MKTSIKTEDEITSYLPGSPDFGIALKGETQNN